jgi:hypothetical protein
LNTNKSQDELKSPHTANTVRAVIEANGLEIGNRTNMLPSGMLNSHSSEAMSGNSRDDENKDQASPQSQMNIHENANSNFVTFKNEEVR